MYHDPRWHDEMHVRNVAESARERRNKTGLAATPTVVLIWLFPLLLMARACIWTRQKITGR